MNRNNYDVSAAIKRFYKDKGMNVRVRSVFAGRLANAIVVDSTNQNVLEAFADNVGFGVVYKSDYNDRLVFEYAPE